MSKVWMEETEQVIDTTSGTVHPLLLSSPAQIQNNNESFVIKHWPSFTLVNIFAFMCLFLSIAIFTSSSFSVIFCLANLLPFSVSSHFMPLCFRCVSGDKNRYFYCLTNDFLSTTIILS